MPYGNFFSSDAEEELVDMALQVSMREKSEIEESGR